MQVETAEVPDLNAGQREPMQVDTAEVSDFNAGQRHDLQIERCRVLAEERGADRVPNGG